MFDGILQTHGKLLGGIAAFLFLIVMLVGEPDSPGVLSDVQSQADAASANGQPLLPTQIETDPLPPTGVGLTGRSDAIGTNRITLSNSSNPAPSALPSPSNDSAPRGVVNPRTPPRGPPPSEVGRPAL